MDELDEVPAVCPHCGPVTADVATAEVSAWGSEEAIATHRTRVCSVCDQPLVQ